jgi:hypothetical protein
MRNKAESKKGQSGQILIYTTIIAMLAALILVPLMQFAFTSHRSAQIREERTLELYASDAGIEDALYQIKTEKKGTDLGNLLFGDTYSYNTGTPGMNDRIENVSVQKVWIPQDLPGNLKTDQPTTGTDKSSDLVVVGMLSSIQATAASEDFNSGGWTGGTGWAGAWTHTGSAGIVSSTQGCGGAGYSLGFADAEGYAERTANLLKYMKPQLKFNAKASSFEPGDTVDLKVKYDNGEEKIVETWEDGNETAGCTAFNIDLSDLYDPDKGNTSVPLQITFDANLSTQTVAEDDFNTGTWTGGSGWSGNWVSAGSATLVTTGGPNSAPYHVKLTSTGEAKRKVDLIGIDRPHLKFWAKASNFGSGNQAYLTVSGDGIPPTRILTWTTSQAYTLYDVDLSSYQGARNFWISFKGGMTSTTNTLASDNFESGGWSGGSGSWAGSWSHSGESAVVAEYAHGGSRSLRLRSNTGVAQRAVSISDYDAPRLQFWARTRSFESGDKAYCYVGTSDTGPWYLVQSWTATQSYTYYNIALPSQVSGASTVWVRFQSAMSDTGDYLYIDDLKMVDSVRFYVDDVSITEGDSFYADDLWIGDEYNSNTIEIAYTDATLGDVFLDRVGVWLPPGCHYVAVVGNETTVELRQEPTTILSSTYADGTIVEWDFASPGVPLHQPPGQLPIVKTLTFTYELDVAQTAEGMFTWIKAHGPSGQTYISWDKGYEIYKAVSQAHSEIYGTNTQVTAYAAQGEVNKTNAASYGDYVATGNPLLIDYAGSAYVKEKVINPSDPNTWVTKDGFLYDGRSDITSIPSDAEVVAGWLYWSAFMNNSDWTGFGSKPDGNVSFMYPKRYGPETFAVHAGDGNDAYTTAAWGSAQEPIDLLAHEPVLTLSQVRYLGEVLGNATAGHGNDTFFTAHKPIQSPAPQVRVAGALKSQSGNYTIDYNTGNVTIINDALSGAVTIDYWASGSMTLTKGTDYTINQTTLGSDIRYTGFTVGNDNLQGTVTIDYYYAKHWETVLHAAYDKYGTALDPAQTVVPPSSPVGHTYACFADVTDLLEAAAGSIGEHPGKGQYAVGNVKATPGVDGSGWDTRSFSGWSLIVLYKSASETAHQFYLYDPIHNPDECPFMMIPSTDPPYEDPNIEDFTLKDFYPPEGTVEGRTTYFVGEGDWVYSGDSVGFKGVSRTSYAYLSGPNNPAADDVMNTVSTTGEKGIDIDTFNILDEVGSDTEANVRLVTRGDRWYLVYMILSFKTNEVPKADYAFSVASVTYQYELGSQ